MTRDHGIFTPADVTEKMRRGLQTATGGTDSDGNYIEIDGTIKVYDRDVASVDEAIRRYQEEHPND